MSSRSLFPPIPSTSNGDIVVEEPYGEGQESEIINLHPDRLTPRNREMATNAFRTLMVSFGLNPDSTHLKESPRRVFDMYREFFFEEPWTFSTFPSESKGLILVRDIPFVSICAHHWLPFYGIAHVAYIPKDRMVGLSKLSRVIQSFSKGPNLQESIGYDSAEFLVEKLDPLGVAIIIRAEHTCMTVRGTKAHGSTTVTSELRGSFLDEPSAREELMFLLR